MKRFKQIFNHQPPARLIALGFASTILLGTLLLLMPFSIRPGITVQPVDALFSATSAVCVTGLLTVDTADTFTPVGQVVMAVLIQIGGLGITSIGMGLALAAGRRISLRERTLIREAMNVGSLEGMVRLVRAIIKLTLAFELAGVIPILTLLSLSMLLSQLSLLSLRFRELMCGTPSILIRNGKLQQDAMRKNRYTLDELLAWVDKYCEAVKPYITNTTAFLRDAQKAGKSILFEAQLGALRDLDYGIYPYTTSSNAVAAYAPVGSGLPTAKLDEVVGVVKAYSSCVGDGPFVTELAMTEEEKHALREAGHEYGAATGRPRRVGPIDLVASRYGVFCQGCDEVALTLLDVLDYMEKIPMVTAYKLSDGTTTTRFPMGEALDTAQPVVEYLPGWHCDITAARKWEDLPKEAQNYVEYLEKAVGCKITYISVGAEREAYIHHVV